MSAGRIDHNYFITIFLQCRTHHVALPIVLISLSGLGIAERSFAAMAKARAATRRATAAAEAIVVKASQAGV